MIPLQPETVLENNPSKGANNKGQVSYCIIYFPSYAL
jgi:hypothetical protein